MMDIGFDNAIAFVMIFGILVFLHELGHFMVAKWAGIRVEVFSLGFGPRLFGWTSAGTDYRVSLVPLGGYVKMLGEEEAMDMVADPRDGKPESNGDEHAGEMPPMAAAFETPVEQHPDAFSSKTRWQRFLVMVAGGVMNLVLAVLILTAVNMVGRQENAFPYETPRLASVVDGSPAAEAGLQRGDRILAVDGVAMESWQTLRQTVMFNPGATIQVTVERDTGVLDLPVAVALPPEDNPTARYRVGYIGLGAPAYDVQVWQVEDDSRAAQAGILSGDLVRSIDGDPILSSEDVAGLVGPRPDEEILVQVERAGVLKEIKAVPDNRDGKGLLGVSTGPTIIVRDLSFGQAVTASLQENYENIGLFFTVLGKLLTGGMSVRSISGPVDIFIFSGAALRQGWMPYLELMALFSLQLGVLNLLPVPFLDGGHIAVLGIEGILRRDLSMRLKERILQVGFVALIMLMALVLWSDLAKNFDLLFGWIFS